MSLNPAKQNSIDDLDLCDAYFSLMENSSECPLLYHRWSLISSVGALLGRQAWIPFGIDTFYPNMYICLMGNAGTRKSSAVKSSRKLLETTGYNFFARERSSKEKFIKDLGDGFGNIGGNTNSDENADPFEEKLLKNLKLEDSGVKSTVTSEAYINVGELEDFLGQGDSAFMSLLTNMWDNLPKYDHGKISNNDIYIHEPTISMLGGCTPTTFNTVFPPEVIGQGMLSRMILVYGEGARKRITLPPPPDAKLFETIGNILYDIKKNIKGEFIVTPEAYKIWDDIYQTQVVMHDSRFENYVNRRHVHYYKLCMVLAAMELSMEITEAIAIKANTILFYTESHMSKALGEFGRAKNSDNVTTVYNIILNNWKETTKGMTPEEIYAHVSRDFESYSKDFSECLTKLKINKKIEARQGKFVPIMHEAINSIPHTNLDLLREYREYKKAKLKVNFK